MKNNNKPFACEHCHKRFKIETWRDRHVEAKHPEAVAVDESPEADHYTEMTVLHEIFKRYDALSAEGQAFVLAKLNEKD